MPAPILPSLDAVIAGLAASPSTCVLIEGIGAREVALRIHEATFSSQRAPFVYVDCACLGHEDAPASILCIDSKRIAQSRTLDFNGRGTLFLDEVSSLPSADQARISKLIDRASCERAVGAVATPSELRVIGGLRGDALREVQRGRLRPDLHARLSVVPLRLSGPAD